MKGRVFFAYVMILTLLLVQQTSLFANDSLKEKIREAISIRYLNDVDVSVNDEGHVTLEGQVPTLYDKFVIFETVSRVPGVTTITNQIVVNAPIIADEVIRQNILQQLDFVSSIYEPEKIQVSVNDRIVYLDGEVNFYREKLVMRTISSWQEGVRGIVNRIKVMPPEQAKSDENLHRVIQHVLQDEFPIEDNVKIKVEDSKVALNGTASSLWAKFNIEEEVLNIIGIQVVDNNLVVEPLFQTN